jgi:asparagine synthetase B (glutamine-hydrolysing)
LNADWFRERGVGVEETQNEVSGQNLHELLAESFWESSLPRLLRCADRNSMAHSVESRVPFLTPALVQFCFSLPDNYLVNADGVRKAVFRTAMAGTVPDCILRRSDKIGLSTPDWLSECADRATTRNTRKGIGGEPFAWCAGRRCLTWPTDRLAHEIQSQQCAASPASSRTIAARWRPNS